MFVRTFAGAVAGIDAVAVTVEVNIAGGGLGMYLVGLPDNAVKESEQRIRAAFENSGERMSGKKVVVSLAPADLRKEGSGFDLPIAVGILAAMGRIDAEAVDGTMFIGELSLDGSILPVKGALPIAMQALKEGFAGIILPEENAREAAVVKGLDVYGIGIFITGESGVGKSETALELVKRGHRLVADDAVELRKITAQRISGTSPDNIRHFLELRGIGIINARRLFGMGSVKVSEKIDMVVKMEVWDPEKVYDRMGLEEEFATILGLKIPCHTIPIKPGRNLAIILEVAAMNNRQKKMGYNAAQELMHNLGMPVEETTASWEAY